MPYIDEEDVKTFLDIDLTSAGSGLVQAIIPAVSAAADAELNRHWEDSTTITDVFDGGVTTLFPSVVPIGAVVSLSVDGNTLGTDEYFVYSTYLRLDVPATRGYRNVTLVYTANVPLPDDMKLALTQWAAEIFKSAEDAGKVTKSATVGSVRVDFIARDGMPQFVRDVLNRYRLIPV